MLSPSVLLDPVITNRYRLLRRDMSEELVVLAEKRLGAARALAAAARPPVRYTRWPVFRKRMVAEHPNS